MALPAAAQQKGDDDDDDKPMFDFVTGTWDSEPFVSPHGSHQTRNHAGTKGVKLADLPNQQGLI